MSHQVALSFEDGVTRFITCAENQTVADASYRARINIPLDCRDGACGTCKAFCESGEFDGGTYIDDALTAVEAGKGFALPCSMKPRSDLVLQIASTSAVAKTRAATFTGQVVALDRLSPTTVSLAITTPERSDLAFLPGQYVNIQVPGTEDSRSYSFSNALDSEQLTFLIKLTPGGVMSEYLTERAAVGDEISFTGPNGSFFLRENERPALLIAGGTGLAPILSILRRLRDDGTTRPIHLVYGVSADDDLVELETLKELSEEIETLTWDHCVSDPESSATNKGYVMSLIHSDNVNDGDVAVYLCGPPPMVEAVRSHFSDAGIEPAGFFFEKFALSKAGAAVESSPEVIPVEAVEPEPEVARREVADLIIALDGRSIAGQVVFARSAALVASGEATVALPDREATARAIAGQTVFGDRGVGDARPLDQEHGLIESVESRAIAGQAIFDVRPDDTALVGREPGATPKAAVEPEAHEGYEIGEEHPSISESDDIFEARKALELGALELTIGRLDSRQLAGYRLLADLTLPYVDGDRFIDAAAYTQTNAAFHDYVFTQTGNEHLLKAYQTLGVKGRMEEVLRNASWCHPRCATDHVEIVDAFKRGDKETARLLFTEHADRSKQTMRRAMRDAAAKRRRLAFVTPGRYDGKVVLLTGAAQGIGECTARRISAEGGILVLADRSELVVDLAKELADDGPEKLSVIADLETWEGAERVVAAAMEKFGRIDVAIHTVGGTIWQKPFHHYPPEQIQAEINRSLFPTLWSCRAVAPHMVEQGWGTIINVSSTATRGIHRVPYSAAKGGVNAITQSLALELAPFGIRVAATAPGGTDAPTRRIPRGPSPATEEEVAWQRQTVDQVVDATLVKRYGSLDEQASAIAFLASDEASYITGTILPVAGGDLG